MTGPDMAVMADGPRVTAQDADHHRCNFAECATAPVAPVAAFTTAAVVVPVADATPPPPPSGWDLDSVPPLTPPPRA